jgi:putative Mn2+ efflux pump MntP
MIGKLLILGFALSLDNFRTAVALGPLGFGWRRTLRIAIVFGFWDGVAPLIGILIGEAVGQAIGSTGDYIGAAALAAFGAYLIINAWRNPEPEAERSERVMLFGLPIPLSVDNVVAGTSLGLLGFSPWVAPPLFGSTTALMSIAGLALGRVAGRIIRIRPDLLTGTALVIMAPLLALGVLG